MDLDKIKELWKNAEVKSSADEEKIQQILSNKGKSAYSNLIAFDKIGLYVTTAALVPIVMLCILKPGVVVIYFLLSLIFAGMWQFYKLRFLKSIDVVGMNVLEVARKINTYKKYISKELIIAVLWTMCTCIFLLYDDIDFAYKVNYASSLSPNIQILIKWFILFVFIIGITFIVYKLTFARYMRKLQEAIQEVEDIEKENE